MNTIADNGPASSPITLSADEGLDGRAALAQRLLDRGATFEALELLKQSLLADHRHIPTLVVFARAQLKWGNILQAETACRLALQGGPDDPAALKELSTVLLNSSRASEALAVVDGLLTRNPADPDAQRRRANALKVLGRTDEARETLRKLNGADPTAASVLISLAEIERFTPGHAVVGRLRTAIETADAHDPLLASLHYALGRAFDQIGEYDAAFGEFERGGALTRPRVTYDEAFSLATLARIPEIFTPALMARRYGLADPPPRPAPVFIVGMPRSGSTLVEQILSRHPAAHCAGEILAFAEALADVRRQMPALPLYPDFIPLIDDAALDGVAVSYRGAIGRLAGDAALHVNKLLGNFMFMGAIRLTMPDARFIVVERDPLDSCLSAFSLHFDQRVPYTYDLSELGRYYVAYRRTMAHWTKVLPSDCIHRMRYETLVGDIEGETRRLLDFLGLEWEPDCLSFYESRRPVLTASLAQVRRPLYASSIGRWRAYERHLGPLIAALGTEA